MNKRHYRSQKPAPAVVPLILIGVGLILVGIFAVILLPKPENNSEVGDGKRSLPSSIPVTVDFPAPDLNLNDINGNVVTLSDYRGQIVLVNHWATWCPPCKSEMPTLLAYFEDYQQQGFVIIAIDAGESVDIVQDFTQAYGLTFPVWVDLHFQAMAAFRTSALPSSFVIDRDGTVRLAWSGIISREMLEKHLTPLLEE